MRFGNRVAPMRTKDEIEELAWCARSDLGLLPFERPPVLRLIELSLPRLIRNFSYEVVEAGKIGRAEALTYDNRPHIVFDERTYRDLERDDGRARMTAMHEVGHLLLHTNQTAHAFQAVPDRRLDPEWQADVFAAAFLMPECAFRQMTSIHQARMAFGVSRDAAWYRARSLKMRKMMNNPSRGKQKKKGYDKSRTP